MKRIRNNISRKALLIAPAILALGASSAMADDSNITAASTAITALTSQATTAAGGIILLAVVWAGVKLGKRLLAKF